MESSFSPPACTPNRSSAERVDAYGGKTYDCSAAVKLREDIGVDLGISRQYSRYQATTYNVVGKKVLCGNNDWPSLAGKLRERYDDRKWLP